MITLGFRTPLGYHPQVLIGRDAETRRLDELIADVCRGRSSVLVLRGEPGIGKTALLQQAADRATGMRVLWTRGIESETTIAHAGLISLTRPIASLVDRLPAAQARALNNALGLGAASPTDRYTVYAALLSLLAAAAEDSPLLVIADDLQWLDRSTRDALLFVAHRIESDRIALLCATRDDLLDGADPFGDLPGIELAGLDAASALELVSGVTGIQANRSVLDELVALTDGNPLALLELPRVMTQAQLRGSAPLEDPLLVGENVRRSFLRRVRTLPAATREALLVVAAADAPLADLIARALSADRGLGDLEAAERAGLLTVEGDELAFRHPLVRSAVYHDATPPDQRAAHARLAAAYEGRDPARWAWHAGRATALPDDRIAAALAAVGDEALQRAGPAAAGRAFAESARLTTDPMTRAGRTLSAARAAALGGESALASRLVDALLASETDKTVRAQGELVRAEIGSFRSRASETLPRLRAAAERARAMPPASGALLTFVALVSFQCGRIADAAQAGEEAVSALEGSGGPIELLATAIAAESMLLAGRAERGRALLRRARALAEASAAGPLDQALPLAILGLVLMIDEDADGARTALDQVIDAGRTFSAPSILPFALTTSAELRLRTGEWASAYAEAAEGARLAHDTGQANVLGYSLATLARVEALQGRAVDCRRHAAAALDRARSDGTDSLLVYAGTALGQLALGNGRLDDAIRELEGVRAAVQRFGLAEANIVQWEGDLAEAYLRAGRRADAERAIHRLEEAAAAMGRRWAGAVAARCRAALDDDPDAAFARALALARALGSPFDLARTELLQGERLRRVGRRTDARAPLIAALRTFQRLGAAPWVERTAAELAALGGSRTLRPDPMGDLTSQELHVALVAGRGATNREAAASLFITVKTVEFHLRNVYAKLGIRSRTELAVWVERRQPAA